MTADKGSTRVPATHPDETAKALHLLIHDLRAPLSVAQGYLRLLQQNRLEAETDRQRAMTQSIEALDRGLLDEHQLEVLRHSTGRDITAALILLDAVFKKFIPRMDATRHINPDSGTQRQL